jgi:predicted MPP superfamily phosphohydrolase
MLLFAVIIILIDIYVFKGIKSICKSISFTWIKVLIYSIFWFITFIFVLGIVLVISNGLSDRDARAQRNLFFFIGCYLTIYVPKIIFIFFHFTEDILKGVFYVLNRLFGKRSRIISKGNQNISRSKFLSRIGLILAALPFYAIIYGMVKGRFDFRLFYEKFYFSNLPETFHGLKIVQISDIHIGGLYGHWRRVEEAIDLINAQNPDLIFFTGDLVNDFANELEGWMPILGKMKAKLGKYSILGNHDYGDYHYWETREAKRANFERIKTVHKDLGFNLLLNESESIGVQDKQIAIIGVENWGKPPFAQYGDFDLAHKGVEKVPFKILLSHDPSHWDAKILGRTNVDLTLSGHTHGMQFGFEIGKIKWSPIQMKYPRWAGLYKEGNQYLYINRGLGYIGYPGRIGMPPEITIFELFKA